MKKKIKMNESFAIRLHSNMRKIIRIYAERMKISESQVIRDALCFLFFDKDLTGGKNGKS